MSESENSWILVPEAGLAPLDLKIRLKSRKVAPSNQVRLDVRRLRYESVAQEYERELAESLGEPNDSDDPEKLWTDFKTKVLKVSEGLHLERPKAF